MSIALQNLVTETSSSIAASILHNLQSQNGSALSADQQAAAKVNKDHWKNLKDSKKNQQKSQTGMKLSQLSQWKDLDQIAAGLEPLLTAEKEMEFFMPKNFGGIGSELNMIDRELRFIPDHYNDRLPGLRGAAGFSENDIIDQAWEPWLPGLRGATGYDVDDYLAKDAYQSGLRTSNAYAEERNLENYDWDMEQRYYQAEAEYERATEIEDKRRYERESIAAEARATWEAEELRREEEARIEKDQRRAYEAAEMEYSAAFKNHKRAEMDHVAAMNARVMRDSVLLKEYGIPDEPHPHGKSAREIVDYAFFSQMHH